MEIELKKRTQRMIVLTEKTKTRLENLLESAQRFMHPEPAHLIDGRLTFRGNPEGDQTRKNQLLARAAGVWNRENGNRIKGCTVSAPHWPTS